MKKTLIVLIMLGSTLAAFTKSKDKQPVPVIITAGQSNTDGRVSNKELPDYILQNKYTYCKWCYGSADMSINGSFEPFWPKIANRNNPNRWAYDAVTYYWLEQALQRDFYIIKWSLGGTAIDTACRSTGSKYWSADPDWLKANHSTATGGKSLLLSFTENIDACIDHHLSKLAQGYDIKAFLWHQGESDRHQGRNYYQNLKGVVEYVRQHLVKKTGDKKYQKLPFICGTVARSNKQYNADVEKGMYQLAQEDENFHVIDMSNGELQKDQLHFTAKSAEYLGVAMYNKLVELGAVGKQIGVIGDSYVRNHRDKIENTWHYKFARKHGMQYFNYGRNGNCISIDLQRWGQGMYERYKTMKDSLDYVVVIAGHNDAARMDSIGMDLFKERLHVLCKGLIEKYPTAKIYFFTPWTCENFIGSHRQAVVDSMLQICGSYGIPVFDAARNSNIFAANTQFRKIYFQGGTGKDTAHLNAEGHDRFLPIAEKFILEH